MFNGKDFSKFLIIVNFLKLVLFFVVKCLIGKNTNISQIILYKLPECINYFQIYYILVYKISFYI